MVVGLALIVVGLWQGNVFEVALGGGALGLPGFSGLIAAGSVKA